MKQKVTIYKEEGFKSIDVRCNTQEVGDKDPILLSFNLQNNEHTNNEDEHWITFCCGNYNSETGWKYQYDLEELSKEDLKRLINGLTKLYKGEIK